MSLTLRRLCHLCAAALTLLTLGTATAAAEEGAAGEAAPEEWIFDVGETGHLEVTAELGSIRVKLADGEEAGTARLEVERSGEAGKTAPLRVEVDRRRGDLIHLDARLVPERRGADFDPFAVTYRIQVPAGFSADLRTDGGNVSVREIDGAVRAHTDGGDLELISLGGVAEGSTGGGDVRVRETRSAVDVSTTGGNVEIRDNQGPVEARTEGGGVSVASPRGEVRAHTVGGEVYAHLPLAPRGPLRLSSDGSPIEVRLNPEIGVTVDARGAGGTVTARGRLATLLSGRDDGSRLSGVLGGGGPQVELRSAGGSITLIPLEQARAATPPVKSLAETDVVPVAARFTEWKDDVRLVLLLSPGCNSCLVAARDVQERVLDRIPSSDLRVITIWLKLLGSDDYALAQEAAASLPDPRSAHYWDPNRVLAWEYGSLLPLPESYGWDFAVDVFLLFDRGAVWEVGGPLPRPDVWFHELGEDENTLEIEELYEAVTALVSGEATAGEEGRTTR